jgi:uncharacterized OB-fold protein
MSIIPVVNYLILDNGDPHLEAQECENCGALYFGRRSACGRCFTRGPFKKRDLNISGTVRAFTAVKRGALGAGFVSAIVDLDGGGNVKGNLVNADVDRPADIKLGAPVRLTTYTVGTDDDGNEAVAFGFETI